MSNPHPSKIILKMISPKHRSVNYQRKECRLQKKGFRLSKKGIANGGYNFQSLIVTLTSLIIFVLSFDLLLEELTNVAQQFML
jgi:hypothetical protein